MLDKKIIIILCGQTLKQMIEKRARQLEMSAPVYLKYSVIKEIEENDAEEKEMNKHGETKY